MDQEVFKYQQDNQRFYFSILKKNITSGSLRSSTKLQKPVFGAGEMVQWLRTPVPLTENLSLVPRIPFSGSQPSLERHIQTCKNIKSVSCCIYQFSKTSQLCANNCHFLSVTTSVKELWHCLIIPLIPARTMQSRILSLNMRKQTRRG